MNQTPVVKKSFIEQAIETAVPLQANNLSETLSAAESIYTEIDNLLPLESGQKKELLTMGHKKAQRVAVIAAMQAAGEEYKEFSTKAFGYRDENGLPALVPFSLSENLSIFSNEGFSKGVPEYVRGFYKDIAPKLYEHAVNLNAGISTRNNKIFGRILLKAFTISFSVCILMLLSVYYFMVSGTAGLVAWMCGVGVITTIGSLITAMAITDMTKEPFVQQCLVTAEFDGLIPEVVRQKIRRALSLGIFGNKVFILAEVPGLEIKPIPLPKPASIGDPLVIGFNGSDFYLIAAFDTKPVELMAQVEPVDQKPTT